MRPSLITQIRFKKSPFWLLGLISTVALFSSVQAQTTTVTPAEYHGLLENPLMGYRDRGDSQIARDYILWNQLENTESDTVQKIRDFCNQEWASYPAQNKKVIPRVYLQWDGNDTAGGWPSDLTSFNWTDQRLKDRAVRLIGRLGEVWDNDPRVAWVQMGIIGWWGEQEQPVSVSEHGWAQILSDACKAAFKNKRVLVRNLDSFGNHEFGNYWDSYAVSPYNGMTGQGGVIQRHNAQGLFLNHFMEGEVAYDLTFSTDANGVRTPTAYGQFIGTTANETMANPTFRQNMIDQIRGYHTTGLGWLSSYNANDPVVAAGAAEVHKAFGYRFKITEFTCPTRVEPGANLAINFKVQNVGATPFYEPWPVALVLVNPSTRLIASTLPLSDVDVRQWEPGRNYNTTTKGYDIAPVEHSISRSVVVPSSLATGEYLIGLSILEPTTQTPGVFFANPNFLKQSQTQPLCRMGVGVTPTTTALSVSFDHLVQDDARFYSATNPLPSVSVIASAPGASEPATNGAFTFTRTGNLSSALQVSYQVKGIATKGVDYQDLGTSVNFPAGQASVTKTVTVFNDTHLEPSENVQLTLLPGVGYTMSRDNSAEVIIQDNDITATVPQISLVGGWVQGNTRPKEVGSNRALVVMVHGKSWGTPRAASVFYGGQRMVKVDERTFNSGGIVSTAAFVLDEAGVAAATSEKIDVIWGRTWGEEPNIGSEITSAFFANVNQSAPIRSFASNGLTGTSIETAPLVTGLEDMVVVGGTSNASGSYTIDNGFTRGIPETSTPAGDVTTAYKLAGSLSETPRLTHSASSGQTMVGLVLRKIEPSVAPGVTTTVTVTATDAYASEPTDTGTFTFTRTGSTTDPLTVNYTVSGTATSGADYNSLGTSVTFLAGQDTVTQTVSVINDTTSEPTETVVVAMAVSYDYNMGVPFTATVNLLSDDVTSAVTTLSGWVSGTSNPKVSGSNRLMTVMVMGEHSGEFSATGVTYGGQTMTKQVERMYFVSGNRTYAAIFTLNEAGVNAASSGTIAVTWSASPSSGSAVYSVLLGGVDQTTSVSSPVHNALSGTTISTSTLSTAAGDLVIACGATEANNTITFNNGFTEHFESNTSWGDATGASKPATGASETPSFTQSASGRMVLCGMVVKKAVPTVTLGVTASDGSVVVDPPWSAHFPGQVVNLIAVPNPGYILQSWGGNLSGSANPASITMDANKSVSATFVPIPSFTLTSPSVPNGTVAFDPPGSSYPLGTVVTVTATPASGYQFANWSGDQSGTLNPTFIIMDGNKNVEANFNLIPTFTLTASAFNNNGTVTLDPPGGSYLQGTVVTVTATPNSGLMFTNWSGDLSGSQNPSTITMSGNRSITANFGAISADRTWDGGGADNHWNRASNWNPDLAPTGGGVLIFIGSIRTTINNDLPSLSVPSFRFDNGSSGNPTNGFVLQGNAVTLTSGIAVTAPFSSSGLITDVIDLPLVLAATKAFNIGGNRIIDIKGNINSTGTFGISKSGGGILIVSGNNTCTGTTQINSGVTRFESTTALPNSNLTISGGTLGLGATNLTRSLGTTNGQVQISSGGFAAFNADRIVNLGGASAALTWGSGFFFTGSSTMSFSSVTTGSISSHTVDFQNPIDLVAAERTFAVANGTATIDAVLSGALSNGAVTKTGTGALQLSGSNTYSGLTAIHEGTLTVSGFSNIGSGNLRIGNAGTTGILNFIGNASSGASTLQIGNGAGTGGATLSANGTPGGTGIKFTAPAFTTPDAAATSAASRSLTLSGENTDANTIAGVIANVNGTTTLTNLSKIGNGRWIIGGSNTYSGTNSVTGGVLQLDHASALGSGNLLLSGGVLGLGAADFTRGLGAGANQIQILGTNSGFAAYGADRNVNFGGASAPVTWGATHLTASGSLALSHETATHTVNIQNPLNLNAAARTFEVRNGAAGIDAILSGQLSNATSITKTGSGTLLLSAANSHSGPTIVNDGTLRLGNNQAIPNSSNVQLGAATLDVSTFAEQAGTLKITAASAAIATINLGTSSSVTFADCSGETWNGGTLNITGAFIAGSSIRFGTTASGLSSTQLGQITLNGTSGNFTLDTNGFLITGVPDAYTAWSAGAAFDEDTNNDGIDNGLAWLLGAANPNVNASNLLPAVTESAGDLKMTFNMLPASARAGAQLFVEHSSDLGITDSWTPVVVPDATGGTAPVTFVVSGTSPLDVEVTISSSKATGGKLFGRLKAKR